MLLIKTRTHSGTFIQCTKLYTNYLTTEIFWSQRFDHNGKLRQMNMSICSVWWTQIRKRDSGLTFPVFIGLFPWSLHFAFYNPFSVPSFLTFYTLSSQVFYNRIHFYLLKSYSFPFKLFPDSSFFSFSFHFVIALALNFFPHSTLLLLISFFRSQLQPFLFFLRHLMLVQFTRKRGRNAQPSETALALLCFAKRNTTAIF